MWAKSASLSALSIEFLRLSSAGENRIWCAAMRTAEPSAAMVPFCSISFSTCSKRAMGIPRPVRDRSSSRLRPGLRGLSA